MQNHLILSEYLLLFRYNPYAKLYLNSNGYSLKGVNDYKMYIKKIRALILCLAITAGMFISLQTVQAENVKWDGESFDYSWYDGQYSPYTISTPAQFAAFGNILNKLDGRDDRFANKTIQLAADIDMGNKPFRAMGGTANGQEFSGTFEGNGHIISNLNITECGLCGECAALFICIKNGGAVRNLGLEKVKINNVKGAINQAAFAGLLIGDYNQPVTIENCFVRDVEFIISNDITNGRIGGFVALVSDWPKEPAGRNNCITNCYAVNVAFKGIGRCNWTIGYFAGPSDGGKFTNCYSGGTLVSAKGFSAEKFGRFGELAQVNNCYSDGADSGKIRFPFNSSGGTQISTAALKGRTGDAVNLGDAFLTIDHDLYNYGYPFLKWEKEKGHVKEDNGPSPAGPLEVASSEQAGDQLYDVALNEIQGAEYRYAAYGKTSDWQDDNIFANLPSGKYTFEARMKENEMYYPSGVITTGEETTLGDLSVWNGVSVDYSWYGDGSASTYTINTAAQFAAFGNILNKMDGRADTFAGKTVQLAADLNMNCKPFRAMGGTKEGQEFKGTFEGGGHIISNLNIAECGLCGDCAALFVCIKNGGTIRNLGLEGVTINNVPGAINQAAFAGLLIGDYNQPVTIENCFVRDVNINLTLPIDKGRVGGFVADVSNYPGDTQNKIMNCYAVNVRLFRKAGEGDVEYGFGHFAGLSEGGMFTNCYSGGVTEGPSNIVLPRKMLSFGILNEVAADNNCYSDCYADDGYFDIWHFPYGGFKRGGKQVSTADLKGMTGDVGLGEGFKRIPGIHYNYGYPVLDWEIPTVYLAETGSDDNSGTHGNPVKTLEKALALVPRIGIIEVEGTVDVSESITLENRIVFFKGSGKLNKTGSNRITGNGIVDFGNFTGDVASLNVFDGLEEVYGPWTIKTTGNYMVYLAGYNENRLEKVWCAAGNASAPIVLTAADTSLAAMGTTVYVWDDNLQPIIAKYTLGEKLQ